MDIQTYTGPILITIVYLALYYGFMVRIAVLKRALAEEYRTRGEKFDRYFGQDRRMLAADRAQLNMLEHMPPFLALMWLNAAFVGVPGATVAGTIYLISRIAYPLVLGGKLGRDVRLSILMVTGPGYAVMLYFLGALLWALVA